jgi:hypothetical protein
MVGVMMTTSGKLLHVVIPSEKYLLCSACTDICAVWKGEKRLMIPADKITNKVEVEIMVITSVNNQRSETLLLTSRRKGLKTLNKTKQKVDNIVNLLFCFIECLQPFTSLFSSTLCSFFSQRLLLTFHKVRCKLCNDGYDKCIVQK